MSKTNTTGILTIITGPMFSGKTGKLISLAAVLNDLKYRILIFKPALDNRYTQAAEMSSHDHKKCRAILVETESTEQMLEAVKESSPTHVLIDEIQFFKNEPIINFIHHCLYRGVNVIASGLLYDYKLQPFGAMPQLIGLAHQSLELYSVCQRCGSFAQHTERVSGGVSTIDVGATDKYIAVCRQCHHIYQEKNGVQDNHD